MANTFEKVSFYKRFKYKGHIKYLENKYKDLIRNNCGYLITIIMILLQIILLCIVSRKSGYHRE